MNTSVLYAEFELLIFLHGDMRWKLSNGNSRQPGNSGRHSVTDKEGMTDEKITIGQTGNSSSYNLNAVRLYLGGR